MHRILLCLSSPARKKCTECACTPLLSRIHSTRSPEPTCASAYAVRARTRACKAFTSVWPTRRECSSRAMDDGSMGCSGWGGTEVGVALGPLGTDQFGLASLRLLRADLRVVFGVRKFAKIEIFVMHHIYHRRRSTNRVLGDWFAFRMALRQQKFQLHSCQQCHEQSNATTASGGASPMTTVRKFSF